MPLNSIQTSSLFCCCFWRCKHLTTMHVCILLVCVWCVRGVMAYPDGRVEESCQSMFPNHTAIQPQTSISPYSVSVNSTAFRPGQSIIVTLQALENASEFQGFMLQAREVGTNTTVGRFTSINTVQSRGLNCLNIENSTLSQASGERKSQFKATWEAPSNPSLSDIHFCVTFVTDYITFWTNVTSPTIRLSVNNTPTKPPPPPAGPQQDSSIPNSYHKYRIMGMLQLGLILLAQTVKLLILL